ncbi:GNAT family protein [Corynebacterium bovis]|uniref:GNAT family N-acetyltransferase n=2 Tax=Corynebacterium bovis TaxID=36808 RepID=UPI00313A08AA
MYLRDRLFRRPVALAGPHPGWPAWTPAVDVPAGRVRLRPLTPADGPLWSAYRVADEHVLRPVEPTVDGSWAEAHSHRAWRATVGSLRRMALAGVALPAAIDLDGRFIGQLTLGNVQHGAVGSCWIGYWVHSAAWNGGVATAAVALGVDHAFRDVGLHRVEATVMESNAASRRVLATCGFREEGRLERNLHIDGRWTDHLLVGVTAEELPEGAVGRLHRAGRVRATGEAGDAAWHRRRPGGET